MDRTIKYYDLDSLKLINQTPVEQGNINQFLFFQNNKDQDRHDDVILGTNSIIKMWDVENLDTLMNLDVPNSHLSDYSIYNKSNG